MGQSDESRQHDVHVWQLDNHHQATRQDGRSKGHEGSLWETNGPRKIDQRQKGAIGNHEFTLTPRSLFSTDESVLRCTDKSQLIRLLQMLGKEAKLEQGRLPSEETGCVDECSIDEDATQVLPTESLGVGRWITDVDGMVWSYYTKCSQPPSE